MARLLALTAGLLCLALLLRVLLLLRVVDAAGAGSTDRQPVYSVAFLAGRLAAQPAAWTGRRLALRAALTDCGPLSGAPAYCLAPTPNEPTGRTAVDPLPVIVPRPDPLWAWLCRVPLFGSLVPTAPPVHWQQFAVYHVRLQVQTRSYCGKPLCYEALLLDATGDALLGV